MSDDPNKPTDQAAEPETSANETVPPESATIAETVGDDAATPGSEDAAPAAEKASPQQAPAPSGGKSRLGLLALLLALVALGGNYWLWTQLQATSSGSSTLASNVDSLRQETAQISARAVKTEAELRTVLEKESAALAAETSAMVEAKTTDLQRQLRQNREQMYELRQQLQSVSADDKRNWLLAEAEYLMRLASQRLLMSRDVAAAADLLQSADEVLQSLDDPALIAVRGEIAQEVAALRTAARFDAEGLYLKLEGVAKQAELLRLYDPPTLEVAEPELPEDASAQEKLEAGVKRAWEKLRSYIVLQKRDVHYERLIAPEQEASLRYSVRLMFEQAQLALLAGNQALYQRALTKAAEWLESYYVLEESTERLVAQIRELAEQPVVNQVPDISGSLSSLKRFVEDDNARRRAGA